MVRSGAHPLDAYNIGSELPKASAVLGRVVQTCFLYFGSYRTTNTAKSVPAGSHVAARAFVQHTVQLCHISSISGTLSTVQLKVLGSCVVILCICYTGCSYNTA